MAWHSRLLKNLPQFVVIHIVKGFGVVNKAEVDVFMELLLFRLSFDLWFLCLFKMQFEHLEFMVHILLKPGLENFEDYFTSM